MLDLWLPSVLVLRTPSHRMIVRRRSLLHYRFAELIECRAKPDSRALCPKALFLGRENLRRPRAQERSARAGRGRPGKERAEETPRQWDALGYKMTRRVN